MSGRFCSSCGASIGPRDSFATQTVANNTPVSTPASQGRRPTSSPASHPSSGSRSQGRFAPGELLGGRYRIIAMLGKGGMGEVYRADDLSLDQPVALKFLPAAVTRNEHGARRAFATKSASRGRSRIPNVCRVYDLGEMEGLYFLSMEYVDGEDLGVAAAAHRTAASSDKALEIARKLCAGLAAAHEKGVLHRDLKPANVMLDGRGQVLLTDFGLAGTGGRNRRRRGAQRHARLHGARATRRARK